MPPLMGVAVNVTGLPAQTVVLVAAMLTAAATAAETVMVIALDVAGEPVAQPELEVMITVTPSPFTKAEEVNVGELVPAFVPFTCH